MPTPHLQHGQIVLGSDATQLAPAVREACSSITIRAHSSNVGAVYLGLEAVTTSDGYELSAGEAVSMDKLDATDLYLVGNPGDKISFMATLV